MTLPNLTLTTALSALMASSALADLPGYAPLTIPAPHHGRDMLGAVWFPSDGASSGGRAFTFAENGVFYGVEVVEEAEVAPGTYPVVVLSHGMGGNIRSLAWLAAGLAERGAVVVSVNHPNSTWGDFDLAAGLAHWTRVQDLSTALDTVLADPDLAPHIDPSRIMAVGFSYGGWTALSMGGMTGDHAGYLSHCETYGAASSHCDDLMSEQIRLADVDPDLWDASYRDARVTYVVAIDPGLTWGLELGDTAGLLENTTLIGLGQDDSRLLATDFDASGFAAFLPEAEVVTLTPAMHFSALPLCKPMGEMILEEEGDDPVCSDPEGTDREAVHRAILDQIASDLGI